MKKATVITNVPIEGIKEAEQLTRTQITVIETDKVIKPVWNPYFKQMWGDFKWLRSLFNGTQDIRCFVTSQAQLREAGIKGHNGMYDLTDNDGILDFYIGLPAKLDKKSKANGFETNFARIYCHEYLHGREQLKGIPDRVHEMEKQGRLKELLKEYRLEDMKADISLLQKMVNILIAMFAKPTTLHQRLPQPYNKMISQGYGVLNSAYRLTNHHIGVDYACPVNTPIYAPWDGEVTVTGNHGTLGNFCYFEYEYGGKKRVERNLHLKYVPKQGKFKRGQVIAHSGNTGFSSGPHYHVDGWWFEVNTGLINKQNWAVVTYDPHID